MSGTLSVAQDLNVMQQLIFQCIRNVKRLLTLACSLQLTQVNQHWVKK